MRRRLLGVFAFTSLLAACSDSGSGDTVDGGGVDETSVIESGTPPTTEAGPDASEPEASPDATIDTAVDATTDSEADASADSTIDASADGSVDGSIVDSTLDGGGDAGPIADDLSSVLWFSGTFGTTTNDIGRHDLKTSTTSRLQKAMTTFDLSSDGSVVAFAGTFLLYGRSELFAMNGSGTGIHLIDTALSIDAVRVSPDGSKVAFIASRGGGSKDVYLVPASGGTVVKVSPNRNPSVTTASQLQPDSMFWSSDSKLLGIVGEYSSVDVHQIWVVDTTVATPAPSAVLSATDVGLVGSYTYVGADPVLPAFFASDDRIVFRARMQIDSKPFLYGVKRDGTGLAKLPGPVPTANVTTFGVSRDGTQVAFASDAAIANAHEVYVMPSTGSTSPLRITSGFVAPYQGPISTMPLAFSPDGTNVAFVGNIGTGTRREPFVVPTAGGGLTRRLAENTNTGVTALAWSPEGKQLAVLSDFTSGKRELYRLKIDVTDQTPTLVESAKDLNFLRWTMPPATTPFPATVGMDAGYADAIATDGAVPGTSHLWFRGDWINPGNYVLGRNDQPTGTTVNLLHESIDVPMMAVAADGTRAVFYGEVTEPRRYDLWTIKRDGSGLTKLVDGADRNDIRNLVISSDGSRVAFVRANDLYVVSTAGGTPAKLSTSPFYYSLRIAFSPDAKTIAVGDSNALYFADMTATSPALTSALPSTDWWSSGLSAPRWISNDEVVVCTGYKYTNGIYRIGPTATAPTLVPGSTGVSSEELAVSPDKTRMVWRTSTQLMMLPVSGGTAVPLTTPMLTIYGELAWKPDGTQIAFVGRLPSGTTAQLMTVPTTASTYPPPYTSIAALPSVYGSTPIRWAPDGSGIALQMMSNIYRTDTLTGPTTLVPVVSTTTSAFFELANWTP